MSFKIRFNAKDEARLKKALRVAPREMETALADAFDHIKRRFFKTLPTVSRINARRRSFFRIFKGFINRSGGRLDRFSFKLVTYWKGAVIQEFGGRKTGRGKLMAIPIGGALTASGKVKKRFRRARDVEDTFVARRGGNLIVFKRKRGRSRPGRQNLTPLYLLKSSVQLTPKLGFQKTWDRLGSFRVQRINKAADRVLAAMART